jgi:amino acid transporter
MKYIKNLYQKLFLTVAGAMVTSQALIAKAGTINPTEPQGSGNIQGMMGAGEDVVQTGTSLVVMVFSLLGFIIVGVSLVSLWRASKEEGRERPMGAVVGLVVGGLCLGIGAIAWAVNRTFTQPGG